MKIFMKQLSILFMYDEPFSSYQMLKKCTLLFLRLGTFNVLIIAV